MYLKAYLIKVDKEDMWFDIIEIPRWMSKRDREIFNRRRKTDYSDYAFTVSTDIEDLIFKIMRSPV